MSYLSRLYYNISSTLTLKVTCRATSVESRSAKVCRNSLPNSCRNVHNIRANVGFENVDMLKVNLKTTMQEDFTRELESQAVNTFYITISVSQHHSDELKNANPGLLKCAIEVY